MKGKLPLYFYSSSPGLEQLLEKLQDHENLEKLHDPKFILEKLLENCEEADKRHNGVSNYAVEELKPRILDAIALYDSGDFKKLAYEMFHLGIETHHVNYVPLLREGAAHVRGVLSAGAKTKAYWESEPDTKKNKILKLYPKKLKELGSRAKAIKSLHKQLGCTKRYVRKIVKEEIEKK